ncbi:MAG: hypothetical protein WBC91_10310 [Phototrophicaceae bacterium]
MNKDMNGCENFDVKLLKNRVKNAVNWYMSMFNATTSTSDLWTSLKPSSMAFDLSSTSNAELKLMTSEVFNLQLKRLENVKSVSETSYRAIYESGHLGIFFPELSVLDRVPEVVSKGFFEPSNYPPFGTWIYFVDENELVNPKLMHIVFWIPPNFVQPVTDAISSCPDGSLVLMATARKICYKKILSYHGLLT